MTLLKTCQVRGGGHPVLRFAGFPLTREQRKVDFEQDPGPAWTVVQVAHDRRAAEG